MTTVGRIYNEALRLLGERRLTSASEARDPRYHLDDAMTDVKAACIEAGYWNFAMRAVSQTHSATLTPSFGFSYAYEKPTDWVRTFIVSPVEDLRRWVDPFNDENDVWWANVTPLYAKYVSNDTSYGYNLGIWPQSFADYVAAMLAQSAGPTIKGISDALAERLEKTVKRTKSIALAKDAMNEPPAFPPRGTWTTARSGFLQSNLDPSPSRTIP